MKKILLTVLIFCFLVGAAYADNVIIGVHAYRFDDTFISSVINAIKQASQKFDNCVVRDSDGKNSQLIQSDNIVNQINLGINGLAVNPVDTTAAATLLSKATSHGIPVVFFNREPEKVDMPDTGWYYVGAKAEESGTMCGEIIADYFIKNPKADKNNDGVIQYVMFLGEPGHQDSILRSEYSVKALKDKGFNVEELASTTAMWSKNTAQDKMQVWLGSFGDKIEAVISTNDDMALGAIESLKAAGYFVGDKFMPVVGVDATSTAIHALKEGTLLGTVLNDAKNIGNATLQLAYLLAQKKSPNKSNFAYTISNNCYVWIPYQKVTIDNYKNFE